MTSPEHLELIGRWFGHPEYDNLMTTGSVASCTEYWDLVATILIAAHEYDHARRHWEERRGVSTRTDAGLDSLAASDDEAASARITFEDYAAARGLVCPGCHESLRYLRHHLPKAGEDVVIVTYTCCACGRETSVEIAAGDLPSGSGREDDDA